MKHAGTGTSQRPRPRLAMAGSGLAAGLISSLAISGLLLLVERMSGLPVGTFYIVLVSALLQTQYAAGDAAPGFLMHLAAGSVIGLVMSAPFAVSKRASVAGGRYAPVYGLAAGFALWAVLFLPITYGIMLPLLNSIDSQDTIRQRTPAGQVYTVATGDLLAMMDRVVAGSLAFNVFYGLLAVMLTRSIYEAYLRRNKAVF